MPTLENFYVTFGQRYSYDEHPTFPEAHPDGWLEIHAEDYWAAREIAVYALGDAWAFIYSEDDFASSRFRYPRGALKVLTQ